MAPEVTFIGHATTCIDVGGVRVLTDPLVRDRVTFLKRVTSSVQRPSVAGIGVILISHLHHDHCDLASLRRYPRVDIVVPVGAGDFLSKRLGRPVIELAVGATIECNGALITAVFADHDGSRAPRGPRAAAVGYVVTGPAGTVYFAGDTDIFDGMANLPTPESMGIDVALLPVWGWGPNLGPGHMNPQRAAKSLELIRPPAAVPIHWGTYFPFGMAKVLPSARPLLTQPPIAFAELAAELAPETKVEILAPGSRWAGSDG